MWLVWLQNKSWQRNFNVWGWGFQKGQCVPRPKPLTLTPCNKNPKGRFSRRPKPLNINPNTPETSIITPKFPDYVTPIRQSLSLPSSSDPGSGNSATRPLCIFINIGLFKGLYLLNRVFDLLQTFRGISRTNIGSNPTNPTEPHEIGPFFQNLFERDTFQIVPKTCGKVN